MKLPPVFTTVILTHALFLVALAILKPMNPLPQKKAKIVVKTIDLHPQKIEPLAVMQEIDDQEVAILEPDPAPIEPEPAATLKPAEEVNEPEVAEESPPPPPPPPPKEKPKPVPPKPAPKPVAKPKTPPKPAPKPPPPPKPVAKPKPPAPPVVKKKTPTPPKKTEAPLAKKAPSKPSPNKEKSARDEKLLAMMKEGIAKLDGTKKTTAALASTPSGKAATIGKLESEGMKVDGVRKLSYEDELAIWLKHRLELPDVGDVKLKLTLTSVGKVVALTSVTSSSEKNKAHVEKRVTSLTFPPFDERMNGESSHTFSIVLKSD